MYQLILVTWPWSSHSVQRSTGRDLRELHTFPLLPCACQTNTGNDRLQGHQWTTGCPDLEMTLTFKKICYSMKDLHLILGHPMITVHVPNQWPTFSTRLKSYFNSLMLKLLLICSEFVLNALFLHAVVLHVCPCSHACVHSVWCTQKCTK